MNESTPSTTIGVKQINHSMSSSTQNLNQPNQNISNVFRISSTKDSEESSISSDNETFNYHIEVFHETYFRVDIAFP